MKKENEIIPNEIAGLLELIESNPKLKPKDIYENHVKGKIDTLIISKYAYQLGGNIVDDLINNKISPQNANEKTKTANKLAAIVGAEIKYLKSSK
jgi:hypothetical protein